MYSNRSPLALSEEEKSPGRPRPEWDQPITKLDQSMKHTSSLSGLNIPRTDFLKALNFERFSARSCLLSSDKTDQKKLLNGQANLLCSEGESEDETANNSIDDEVEQNEEGYSNDELDEEYEQGSENNDEDENVEMGEQEEALNDSDAENQPPIDLSKDPSELDQAELLARFKQLREFQLHEQQRLIVEQQKQLEKLRDEQQRVQDMLIKEQIAALSPQKAMRSQVVGDNMKIKLINIPKKMNHDNRSGSDGSEFDYNHNKKGIVRNALMCDLEQKMNDMEEDEESTPDDVDDEDEEEEVDEDQEEVDEDYLQCSIVETEAEEHISHVEDLLRTSRDLFMSNEKLSEPHHMNEFHQEDMMFRGENRVHDDVRFEERPEVQSAKTPETRPVDLDEQPVSGGTKTFEQLLEEQLQREHVKKETPTSATSSGGAKKRPFLRRGDGLARFGSSPCVRRPTPGSKRKLESFKAVSSPKKPIETYRAVVNSGTTLSGHQKSTQKTSKSPVKQSVLMKKSKSPVVSTPKSGSKRASIDDIDELEEFELLEKYADDYSFSSNCSIINPRTLKTKKPAISFDKLKEEKDFNDEDSEDEDDTLKNSREFGMSSPSKCTNNFHDSGSEPSSTPRRLKRKIATRSGETTTMEKDVMVEDFSPVHNEDDDEVMENNSENESEFDDDETWATTMPKPNFSRPMPSVSKSDTPPTSKLVARLFPSLKSQPKVETQKTKPTPATSNDQGVMSKALKDKLAELEQEIEKFRTENGVLAKIKKERLDALEELKKEVEAFELKKNKELNEIQDMKEEEMKKIRNERKLFEKYQKEMRAIPDKNQRREIEELKMELQEAKDDMRQKETRWAASTNRLKNRIEALEKENAELQEELKLMQAQRLEQWEKEITAKNNEKKKKTQSVPPQQKVVVKEEAESAVTAQLREQFDKLLRASLDECRQDALLISGAVQKEAKPDTSDDVPERRNGPKEPVKNDNKCDNNTKRGVEKPEHAKRINLDIDFGNGKYREIKHHDGKLEREYVNGSKEVIFANGTRKQISANGESVIVSFFNGDMKQILPDQRIVYYYADSKTQHTTYPDGIEILEFPNDQVEKHYPNGTREIVFPDQTIKYLYPGGAEESVFVDGTVVKVDRNGDRVMNFPNGQREIHTKQFKKREYPDGTTKTVYPDGRQETRYSSGRVRIKDAGGNVLVDKIC